MDIFQSLIIVDKENALVKVYSEAAVSILAYSLYKIRKWRKRDAY